MDGGQLKEITELITTLRMDIRELNVKFDHLQRMDQDVKMMAVAVNTAEQKASSAHKRLDAIDSNTTWLWRMVVTTLFGSMCSVAITIFIAVTKLKGG